MRLKEFQNNELIIALTFAVGTPEDRVVEHLKSRLESTFRYDVDVVRITGFLRNSATDVEPQDPFNEIKSLMDRGDKVREKKGNDWLAYRCMKKISEARKAEVTRKAYIITSLKRPEEIRFLRKIYGDSVFTFGLMCEEEFRKNQLIRRGMTPANAVALLCRDYDDRKDFGQCFKDTYPLADFFLKITESSNDGETIDRALHLIFGDPFVFPQWDEYFMYLAFSASLRTADMARQIGAVLVDRNGTLISVGSNDVPAFGGGQYPKDHLDQRDYTRGRDTNTLEIERIKDEIRKTFLTKLTEVEIPAPIKQDVTYVLRRNLDDSLKPISGITEYFRSVHAEMEAILAATRTGRSPIEGTIYTTTFPCHNCAKHIVGAGIKRVVYIEPYGKSRAESLHSDAISLQFENAVESRVCFQPFFGVGPRRFWDLFSLHMSTGKELERKYSNGQMKAFKPESEDMRLFSPMPAVKALEEFVTKIVTISPKDAESVGKPRISAERHSNRLHALKYLFYKKKEQV